MRKRIPKRVALATVIAAIMSGAGSNAHADYASTVVGLNPVVYYKLNEAATVVPTYVATNLGSAGALGNGVYVGDDTQFTEPSSPGPITGDPTGSSVAFSGSGFPFPMGVSIGWSTNINPFPAFSAECWVNYQGGTSGELVAPFASIDGSSSGFVGTGRSGWTFYANGTSWNWRMGNTAGYIANFTDGGLIQVGVWQHLVGVCDGTNAYLYEDGVLVGQQALAAPFLGNLGQTTDIGYSSSFGRNIDAGVAECAIYPYALTSNQIVAHYNARTSANYKQTILNDNPVGYWRLNDGSFTAPPTNTYPLAANAGNLGAAAEGLYLPGTKVGAAGVPFPGFGSDTNSAYFNGVLSGIEMPGIPVQTDEFTFTGWILSTDPQQGEPGQPGYAALVCQNDVEHYTTDDVVWLGYYGNSQGYTGQILNALWFDGTTNTNAIADFGDQPNPVVLPAAFVWNFVAAVWTPTGTTIYLNGLPSPLTGAGPHTSHDFSQSPIWLGSSDNLPISGGYPGGAESDSTSCDFVYEGYMAHPALFSYALTSNQIQSLYTAAMPLAQVTSLTQSPLAPNYEGQTITLTVTAVGPGTNSYQWLLNGTPQSSETSPSFVLNNVTTNSSGNYTVVISNANGSVTSAPIALTVSASKPIIVDQPLPETRYATALATFSVTAVGTAPITYAWSLNSAPITGATDSSYSTIAGATTSGNYSVTLNNSLGSTPSSNALLTVLSLPGGYAGAVIAAQPAAYWRFNETNGLVAHDYVGGNDGNLVENVTNGIAGPDFPGLESNNLSYSFDGVGSKVRCPPIPVNGNTITTVALAQTSTTIAMPGDGAILVSSYAANDVAFFSVSGTYTTDLSYDWNSTTNSTGFDPGGGGGNTNWVFPAGTWCFVAETISATNAVLYMDDGDGHLAITNNPGTNAILPLTSEVDIGGIANLNTGDNATWAGGLDEVAYWRRALSPAEITALHTALLTRIATPITLSAALSGTNIEITFSGGTLQSTTNLNAGFTNVPGSPTSPYTAPRTSSALFFRVEN